MSGDLTGTASMSRFVCSNRQANELFDGGNGQRILVYTARPGSPSRHGLDPVASWTATPDHAPAGQAPAAA